MTRPLLLGYLGVTLFVLLSLEVPLGRLHLLDVERLQRLLHLLQVSRARRLA